MRPNILLLMADQHRGDCVGAAGNSAIHTPNLDRLAGDGALFRCAYSSTPSCIPARAGLLTGASPWRHGMLGFAPMAHRYPFEMPRLLREAGYTTQGIGKMHFRPQRSLHGFDWTLLDESGRSESPGFQSDYRAWFQHQAPDRNPDATGIGWNDYQARPYALPEHLHPTRWTADRAVEFLESQQPRDRFFLKVSFGRPHSPYDPPQRLWDRYNGVALPSAAIAGWANRYAMRGETLPADTWWGDLGSQQVARSRQGYYGNVTFIDEQIGRITEVLERRGLLDQTLIVYISDHGDMLGDHNLWRKTFPYESSARIPVIVRWPVGLSAPRGQIIAEPVELRDILPTLLDAAGVVFDPHSFDGRSLLDLIRGSAGNWRQYIDLEHARCYFPENDWHALTNGRTKYIYFAPTGEEQLFDLETDPQEVNDLSNAPDHRITLESWRSRMVAHLEPRGPHYAADGELAIRTEPLYYSPNFPEPAEPGY